MKKYLIRLDDACPTMDSEKWGRMEELLDKYRIQPLVGIVPECKDENLMRSSYDENFWEKARCWSKKGWAIALHGYDHCYISDRGGEGLNPMWARSEFAGVSLQVQKEKIRKGVSIMRGHDLEIMCFFAPSHTFDENTLIALYEESDIRVISDTIALNPYRYNEFTIIPQIVGCARDMFFPGVFTFCYHPNTMLDNDFVRLEDFIVKNLSSFISFKDIDTTGLREKGLIDKMLSSLFFLYRKVRKLR